MSKIEKRYYVGGAENKENVFKDMRTFKSKSYANKVCEKLNHYFAVWLDVFDIEVIIPDQDFLLRQNKQLTTDLELHKKYLSWFLSGDTGASSETMFHVFTGLKKEKWAPGAIPIDSWDFGRCYRLLQRFPEFRKNLQKIVKMYPCSRWEYVIDIWPTLESVYERESENGTKYVAKITEILKNDRPTKDEL
jgi:hypothetical protein